MQYSMAGQDILIYYSTSLTLVQGLRLPLVVTGTRYSHCGQSQASFLFNAGGGGGDGCSEISPHARHGMHIQQNRTMIHTEENTRMILWQVQ